MQTTSRSVNGGLPEPDEILYDGTNAPTPAGATSPAAMEEVEEEEESPGRRHLAQTKMYDPASGQNTDGEGDTHRSVRCSILALQGRAIIPHPVTHT